MTNPTPQRRRFSPTPAWLLYGLLAVEGLLWLSERYTWFWFNEKKGWTGLIAVAVVGGAMILMLLWLIACLLFRWRFQFSIRSLLVLTVAVAIPCSWLGVSIREARRELEAAKELKHSGGYFEWSKPSGPGWLRNLLGDGFFQYVESPEWYASYMKQWDSLLGKAGLHQHGLVLEARIINERLSTPSHLLLGVRNVGDGPVAIIEGAMEERPILLVRDVTGKPVFLTDKGESYHNPNWVAAGSNRLVEITPGMVGDSFSIPLHENFVLKRPGRYTVLAIKSVRGCPEGVFVVARPVTLEVPESALIDAPEKQKVKDDNQPPARGGVTDEWAALEAKAGVLQQGYILEADISPVHPVDRNLIVSLVNISADAVNDTPFFASDPKAYRILLRDPSGTLVPIDEGARNGFVVTEKNRPHGCSVHLGTGNGAVIPLAQWFDMRTPGDYTVLVSLPFPRREDSVCVAKPFKVTVTKPGNYQLPKGH